MHLFCDIQGAIKEGIHEFIYVDTNFYFFSKKTDTSQFKNFYFLLKK